MDNNEYAALQAGADPLDCDKLKKGRVKPSECLTCGMKLIKVGNLASGNGKKKTANVGGKNVGRCLMCHPLDPDEQLQVGHPPVPKFLVVEADEESAISDVTLDRRLQLMDDENHHSALHAGRFIDDFSKAVSSNGTRSSRLRKANHFNDQDVESLTESENDDDGANVKHGKYPQHRSGRSMNNNSSHHNAVSLSSSVRNRWGESVAGLDADLSTGPRPLPPKRVPSGENDKNQSLHQSLPSRVTATTVCNTTCQTSPPGGSTSPTPMHGSNQSSRIIIIPNSPTKKSNFTPPWNPKNPSNETVNARKPGDSTKSSERKQADDNWKKEIYFTSNNVVDSSDGKPRRVPPRRVTERSELDDDSVTDRHKKMEITLFGNNNTQPKAIPDFDVQEGNDKMLRASTQGMRLSNEQLMTECRLNRRMSGEVKEIHVDLTSIAQRATRRSSSPTKDVTPRTLKKQKALNMLVHMEQIFPPEHKTSTKPPKKVQRAMSNECDGNAFPTEVMLTIGNCHKAERRSSQRGGESFSGNDSIENKSVKQLLSIMANQASAEKVVAIIRKMTDMMWSKDGSLYRSQFTKENGMEVISTVMWTEMRHAHIQTSILRLLFALGTGSSETHTTGTAPLADDDADVIIDALLITMEQHANVEELQLLGCQVLCCFSSELSSSCDLNDGTRSGACLAVLTAMEAHRDAIALQEWGIRALYNQCVFSKHSEANKKTVILCKLEHALCSDGSGYGMRGGDVLLRVLKNASKFQTNHTFLLEWTCKLYMSLSSMKSMAEMLSPASDLLKTLIRVVRVYQIEPIEDKASANTSELVETALTVITNLLCVDHNKTCINATETLVLAIDTMSAREASLEVSLLCCSIVCKLATEPTLRKDVVVGIEATTRIVDKMKEYPREVLLHETGIRGLALLTLGSEAAKQQLCEADTLKSIVSLFEFETENMCTSSQKLEGICSLIASLYSSDQLQEKALRFNTLSLLQRTMETYQNNVKLQEVAIVALMNLSMGKNVDSLLEGQLVETIVHTMELNKYSVIIQKNACCALWNIGTQTVEGSKAITESNAIEYIVAAVQNHLESYDVVEMACGTLWGLANRSDAIKESIITVEGGLKIIATTLVMHPHRSSLKEKSCGVLSVVSSHICEANALDAAKCISNIISAMRNNPRSIPVLHAGARFLRQVLIHLPRYADEGCDAVSVLMNAMKDNRNALVFQQDACYLLWTMSEKSTEAKEHILSMDGISVLMEILEQNSGVESVENAALAAFKELVMKSSKNKE